MSSKRKWDHTGPEGEEAEPTSVKAVKVEDGKSASEAAAAAAAIAAKIAAQFAGPAGSAAGGSKDPHDGEFTHDIDINDVRNRYLLTKGATQQQIHDDTGASISTKGVWYPDRTKATEKDPPLYLHISATTQEVLQSAIDKVNDLITHDMGSLVEDKTSRRGERRKWPEEKIPVGIDTIRNFNVRAKVVGPSGMFVKYIQQETGTRVQIKGQGSGFVDQETGHEHDEPMFIHVTGPDEQQVMRAKSLTEDLLDVVRGEHAKVKTALQQQQMELHQAQAQYAAYSTYGVCMLRSCWCRSCQSLVQYKSPVTRSWSVFYSVDSLTLAIIGLCTPSTWQCSSAPSTWRAASTATRRECPTTASWCRSGVGSVKWRLGCIQPVLVRAMNFGSWLS
ncbi:uncharacterized protein BXZ73DRAFT_42203 [Epithele typhae]|uniref:uncharacterized protein n=1 Tax=Epithele typhae TaxID=378194 RepID=UPI0020076ADF|nr:uncharacterized protein BXZ73DRAFT_42203 [Epithele typhae]KAH9941180.1 hypothetical protein BXZ73DRAFT_42203 [Epithele typhae]